MSKMISGGDLFIYGIFLLICFGWLFTTGRETGTGGKGKEAENGHVHGYVISAGYVGIFFLITVLFVPLSILMDDEHSVLPVAGMFFNGIMMLGVYLSLLHLIMPLMRRYFRAITCITLWVIPNLIVFIEWYRHPFINAPAGVLIVPEWLLVALLLVWAAGFLTVFIRGYAAHIRFKKLLFADAREVPREVRKLYNDLREEMGVKTSTWNRTFMPAPVISGATNTPLAIGFFTSSTYVVLPNREYTEEELRMIFRHELVHIAREDSMTKLSLLVCRAACWFLPPAIKATDDAAEDMELSCDETVLSGADETKRRAYGRLILSSAADARGFTTCLSASAWSLQYRLKRILSKEKRSLGLPVIAIALFLLMFGFGWITIGADRGTLGDVLHERGISLSDYELIDAYDNMQNDLLLTDASLTIQLEGMPVARLGTTYDFRDDGTTQSLHFRGTDGDDLYITVSEHAVTVNAPSDNSRKEETFYRR